MNIKYFLATFLFFSLMIPTLSASDSILLSAGLTLEPYIIAPISKEKVHTGIESEIVQEAFALEGYDTKIVTLPFQRSKKSLKKGFVQGVLTVRDNNPILKGSFLSSVYITYQNVVVTLAKRNFSITSIDDLSRLSSVVAFQQASLSLGSNFKHYAKSSSSYNELSNQLSQVEMLYRGHIDAAIIDINIFQYLRTKLPAKLIKQQVIYHKIFTSTPYKIAFRRKDLRDTFNRGLSKLHKNGREQLIFQRYFKTPPR